MFGIYDWNGLSSQGMFISRARTAVAVSTGVRL
jgi:hypothetical protein